MLAQNAHTAAALGTPESMQLPLGVQLVETVASAVTPVLNIPPPSPFCPSSGDPPLPWRVWFMVFSSYLCLLEEEQGEPWMDFIQNSILLGLLGTEGHQRFAGSPVLGTVQTASFIIFAQNIAGLFVGLFSTTQAAQPLQYQRVEATIPDSDRIELEWARPELHCHVLESDERSQVDQPTASSGVSPTLSTPPVISAINSSKPFFDSSLRRGRGRVKPPCNNCSQVGRSSGAVRGRSGRKPARLKVQHGRRKQSPGMEKGVELSQSNSIAHPQATPSRQPLFGTAQLLNRASKLVPLCAEVDLESHCTSLVGSSWTGTYLTCQ